MNWKDARPVPQELVALVRAHELTHRRVSKHSAEFWRELGKLVPDFTLRERRLAAAGASVWLGALQYVRL
ncbi:YgjP-like metallopeptidase domain-containing protein [Nocardia vinacea]|uniref:YgjP-like metallopeptidase domain-containing protein n=1 Tax=Nocardia vinacea TaxID=96468 RepID=UPI0033D0F89D